jgi:hypothetical protein
MNYPTPFSEANSRLDELLRQITLILGEQLVGFYIDGSLALGDFDPAHSDIDFLVATRDVLAEAVVSALAAMHWSITNNGRPFAAELEGSYIPLDALRRYDSVNAIHPNLERGLGERLRLKYHHSDWIIHRHIVREYGVILFGPAPDTLLDPITPSDLREATAGVMRSWWSTPEASESIRQGHPGYLTYVVQTICRVLYTWENGKVISKPAACRWAVSALDKEWRPLIRRAEQREVDTDFVDETQRFVHNSLRRFSIV